MEIEFSLAKNPKWSAYTDKRGKVTICLSTILDFNQLYGLLQHEAIHSLITRFGPPTSEKRDHHIIRNMIGDFE